jgi:serine/threonine protein kinase
MTMEQAKLTSEGMLVGTFQYMAPEQLEGKEADARADIFALGELIYEMATGKPAFSGKSRASLIAAILTAEPPPMESLQPMTPVSLSRIVKKCLAKDPDERWQSASDLAAELKWIAEGGSQASATVRIPVGRAKWAHASWILTSIFFLLSLAAGAAWWTANHRPLSAMYFHASVPFAANDLALSPDGRMLAMVGYFAPSNDYMLWTYEVGSRRTTPLEGTHGSAYPSGRRTENRLDSSPTENSRKWKCPEARFRYCAMPPTAAAGRGIAKAQSYSRPTPWDLCCESHLREALPPN